MFRDVTEVPLGLFFCTIKQNAGSNLKQIILGGRNTMASGFVCNCMSCRIHPNTNQTADVNKVSERKKRGKTNKSHEKQAKNLYRPNHGGSESPYKD